MGRACQEGQGQEGVTGGGVVTDLSKKRGEASLLDTACCVCPEIDRLHGLPYLGRCVFVAACVLYNDLSVVFTLKGGNETFVFEQVPGRSPFLSLFSQGRWHSGVAY